MPFSPGCELCTKWGCKKYGNLGRQTLLLRGQNPAVASKVVAVGVVIVFGVVVIGVVVIVVVVLIIIIIRPEVFIPHRSDSRRWQNKHTDGQHDLKT